MSADLPGVDAKEVTLSVEGRELILAGERKLPAADKNACYLDEIAYGPFRRRILLPCEVVGDKTAADYKTGLLRITLPKAPTAKRTKIPINITKT